jgi:hypothetical protein
MVEAISQFSTVKQIEEPRILNPKALTLLLNFINSTEFEAEI